MNTYEKYKLQAPALYEKAWLEAQGYGTYSALAMALTEAYKQGMEDAKELRMGATLK